MADKVKRAKHALQKAKREGVDGDEIRRLRKRLRLEERRKQRKYRP